MYHHEQRADGLDIRPGDIVVMPGKRGVTAWRVVSVAERITIMPMPSHATETERGKKE